MNQKYLDIFILSLKHYFREYDHAEPEIGVPFVKKGDDIFLEMTACISISGEYRGAVYVTLSKNMIKEIAKMVLGGNLLEDIDLVDMAGEFTNIITGNARENLGSGFHISVPLVISGSIQNIHLPRLNQPVYVIPFSWKNENAYLFVGLDTL